MLSLWKLRVGAEEYYLGQVADGLDVYYSGAGETRGRWLGLANQALDLDDEVTGDQLRAVLAGLNPSTGLTPNGDQVKTWKNRVPGFDLTFSAPKSVSVLYALADPLVRAEVVDATNTAVEEAVRWLEREACFVRRGSNNREAKSAPFEHFGTRRLPGVGFIAAGFRHRTSRAGDPHLHTHVLVANLTRGPDGKWSALDGQALYRSKLAAGAMYQSVLRNELSRRLGVEWNTVHNHVADIAGIPHRVVKHFSKRRTEIEAELNRLGLKGPDAARDAMLATRSKKLDIDHDTLDQHWEADAASVDYSPADIAKLLAHPTLLDPEAALSTDTLIAVQAVDTETGERIEEAVSVAEFVASVAWRLPETDAVVTRHDVQNTVTEQLSRHGNSRLVERLTDAVLASPELVPLPVEDGADAGWEQRWTTQRLLDIEHDLTTMFAPIRQPHQALDPGFVDEVLAQIDRPLGPDQADTIRRVCTQGLPVEVVVGRAGTGKTYTMNTVRHVFEAAGRRLIGVAPSARAARELGDGAGIEAYTVPRFRRTCSDTLFSSDVIVIDEAAMTGTVDLWNVCNDARTAGAKVILVGDHHQLPEVNAGGGFAAALEALGNRAAHLTINRRQHHEWEHHALDHLRNGDIGTAWNAYTDHDRVTLTDTREALHERAVGDWWTAHDAGSNAHLLAGTRSEARALNALARQKAAASGTLTGTALTIGGDDFQVGDRVVLLRNDIGHYDLDTHSRCRVDNGMIGTITAIDHHTQEVDLQLGNQRTIRLTGAYVRSGHVDHGYATTIHKAQGMTCDDIFVVGPAGLYREAGYVALSRARNTAHLYATTKDAASIGERPHTDHAIPLPSEHVDDPEHDLITTLERSQAKSFAIAQAPHLSEIARVAQDHHLGSLTARQQHIRDTIRQLEADGFTNPTDVARALARATSHRSFMHVGGRVNALDWDNVGTITHLHDTIGAASVQFTTSDGRHTRTRTMPWSDLKPIDHPEPADIGERAQSYLDGIRETIERHVTEWNSALAEHGINPDEPAIVPAAIEHRTRQLTHHLRAAPPRWLDTWLGARPTDPTGAVVYDDEIRALAAWRDTQQLDTETFGYGPAPVNAALLDEWRTHMDRALDAHAWLAEHRPSPAPEASIPIELRTARERLQELDAMFATAPPDQQKIIDSLLHSKLTIEEKGEALRTANASQEARRDWILEHWPHIVEHHELTEISDQADALHHWPEPLPAAAQAALDEVRATMVDTPEEATIGEIEGAIDQRDPHHELRRLTDERAPLERQLLALRASLADPDLPTPIIEQHIVRLHERLDDLDARIEHAEADVSMWDWGQRQDPGFEAALVRRSNHLAYAAVINHEPWVENLVKEMVRFDQPIEAGSFHHAIAEVAAYRERAAVDSVLPLGPPPMDARLVDEFERALSVIELVGSELDIDSLPPV
jgi:conjugative relaxase-like TrwC/TraI family protein